MSVETKSTARVLVTLKCNRHCKGCANNNTDVIKNATTLKVNDISILKNYKEVCISGGEPMLFPVETAEFAMKIRRDFPEMKIYGYSALYNGGLRSHYLRLFRYIDGFQFTIHDNFNTFDIASFHKFQYLVYQLRQKGSLLGIRLKVSYGQKNPFTIYPNLWSEIRFFDYRKDYPLPINEDLFVLE